MDEKKVIHLHTPKATASIVIDEVITKCYSDRRLNNISMELLMMMDKVLRENGWQFNSMSDIDYVADETLKFLVVFSKKYISNRR